MSYDLADAGADYPEWHGPPRRTLVICTQQRSGSTLLGEAIYFSGGLGCPLEYFHGGFRPGFAARWKADDLPTYVAALHRHRTDPSGTLAIKLFWRDVVRLVREYAPSEFTDLFWFTPAPMPPTIHRRIFAIISEILPNPTFVLLGRRDQIGQAVSHYRAVEARSWRKFVESAAGGEPAHDFDLTFRTLAAIQLHNAHWHDFFAPTARAITRSTMKISRSRTSRHSPASSPRSADPMLIFRRRDCTSRPTVIPKGWRANSLPTRAR